MDRYLIFSEWNNGSEISKESEIIVKNLLETNQIILLGTPIDRWIDSPVINTDNTNFYFHSFFEEIIDETTCKTVENTKNIEYLILQILYYSYKYQVNKFIFIGTLFDSFDFLARLSLITDYTTEIECYLIDNNLVSLSSTNYNNDVDEHYEKKLEALRHSFQRCKKVYTNNNYIINSLELPTEFEIYQHEPSLINYPKLTIEEARIALIETLGIQLPLISNIYFCCNQDINYVLDIIEKFESHCDTLNSFQLNSDSCLLLLLQPRETKEIITKLNESKYSKYILYIPRYLPRIILNQLYSATQYGIHGDKSIFTYEHAKFERIQYDSNEIKKSKKTKLFYYSYGCIHNF